MNPKAYIQIRTSLRNFHSFSRTLEPFENHISCTSFVRLQPYTGVPFQTLLHYKVILLLETLVEDRSEKFSF